MVIKNKIVRDTVMLTVMQLLLDSAALLLNSFITRKTGASAMGILSLTGSFMVLAGTVSNGNAFLCTSRLISEELGKKNGNPNRVLLNGLMLCTFLSVTVSMVLVGFSDTIGTKFFHSENISRAIKLMPVALIMSAFASCFKGYFNACRKSSVTAAADILDFAAKSAVIVIMTMSMKHSSEDSICGVMITGFASGSFISLVFMLIVFARSRQTFSGKSSLTFKKYISFALPIMGGGIITSALSSTNDALIPVTLRQYGDSVSEAFSRFGIFEAIVIPTIFFPSVVLCSMSGIIVSESARASASGNKLRLKMLSEKLIGCTLVFAIFAAAMLMRFGSVIGELLGGGELAGKMITIIAPVVPFIYLEIILEALIKGMGLQGFSSLNYLTEYAVRIAVVLIFIPRFGFYGIVASYYASNIIGNTSRIVKILRHTGTKLNPLKNILLPAAYSFMTLKAAELLSRPFGTDEGKLSANILLAAVWTAGYFIIFMLLKKGKKHEPPLICATSTK